MTYGPSPAEPKVKNQNRFLHFLLRSGLQTLFSSILDRNYTTFQEYYDAQRRLDIYTTYAKRKARHSEHFDFAQGDISRLVFRVGSFLCTPLGLPSYLTFNTFSPSHRYVEIAFTAMAGAFAYGQLGPHLPHKTCSDFGSDGESDGQGGENRTAVAVRSGATANTRAKPD